MSAPMDHAHLLNPDEEGAVAAAIAKVEGKTSAEIKVVIARHCWDDMKRKAAGIFRKLALDKTCERNCVLILLVTANREFLIYGDEGIHALVGQDFWNDVRDLMSAHFRQGEFGAGLAAGVERVGERLACYFPFRPDDRNEIANDVAYED